MLPVVALSMATLASCACGTPDVRVATDASALAEGPWRAVFESPGGELPFGLIFEHDAAGATRATVVNGAERIAVSDAAWNDGRLTLSIEPFDSHIVATPSDGGRRLDGEWTRTSGPGTKTRMAFHALAGEAPRFPADAGETADLERIVGRWQVEFESDDLPSVGLFRRGDDGSIEGTFLNATGDYRYLAGSFDGDRLRLSCFDGGHAFLFVATLSDDDTLRGDFWSRDLWHESWTATRDDEATTVDGFEQTRWSDGARLADLRFPDPEGREWQLDDPDLLGTVTLVEIFGSWCPNCNDAAVFLNDLRGLHGDRGLAVVGLAFEMTGDFERDAEQVRRYAAHHEIDYPLLIAGRSGKAEASKSLPVIDRVRSFPTILFVDAAGAVRAIHSGFSGPATGAAHLEMRARFESLIETLLSEAGA